MNRTSSLRAQSGAMNILLVPFILITLFFVAIAGFGYWANKGRVVYKTQADTVARQAVSAANAELSQKLDADFAKKEANPYSTYTSPSAAGNITLKYPKAWSAYVQEQAGSIPVNAYFHPNFVPTAQSSGSATSFALRLQVVQQSYDSVLQQFDAYVQQKKAAKRTYRSPNIPDTVGAKITGQIGSQSKGTMIILPLRDKTVQIWTESRQFTPIFLKTILPNFTFTP